LEKKKTNIQVLLISTLDGSEEFGVCFGGNIPAGKTPHYQEE
jgi:hypothetical protein